MERFLLLIEFCQHRTYADLLNLVPLNVTILGKWIFAYVVK